MQGYRELRESAAWVDLSARGRIRVTGEDRVRLLHALASNHVQQLRPGEGCYTFFLNAQGRILADANLLCLPDALLLDTEPEAPQSLYAHIDKYIIADDVSLEDITEGTAAIAVEGPAAAEALGRAGAPAPAAAYAHQPWDEGRVMRLSGDAFAVIAPAAQKSELVRRLGVAAADPEAARIVRIEQGRPRYGEDFSDKHLPHETQLLHGVHFTKGCYLGQEIVERVRSRGGVHRFLVRLEIDAAAPPAAGAAITGGEGKELGAVTSAAFSPALGKVVGFAYVRLNEIGAQTPLYVQGAKVSISPRARPAP